MTATLPLIGPLGDSALLVRFDTVLSDSANRRAIAFARQLTTTPPAGVIEIDPNLVSVLIRFNAAKTTPDALAGELRLLLSSPPPETASPDAHHRIKARFDGADLPTVAAALNLTPEAFIAAHNAAPLRVLTTGFAPGFVYCGFHPAALNLPRRDTVRASVPSGTILFAAGLSAITATAIPTGWHVIGSTDFANFDPNREPPTQLREGDLIGFEAEP